MSLAPCDRTTPRCVEARDYGVKTPECCLAGIREVTLYTISLFEREGIPYWLDYGSLLGAVRHKGIIPHDKDSDLGILAEDRDRMLALVPEIEAAGYHTHYRAATRDVWGGGDRLKVRLSEVNHSNVDVFIWEQRPGGLRHRQAYIACDRYKGREFPEDRLIPLGWAEWEGERLRVPKDVDWFLVHRYGENWRTSVAANNDGVRR